MRFILLFLGLLNIVSAQTKDTEATKRTDRTCRILFLDRPESISKAAYLYDGSALQEVELSRHNFSCVYKIASGETSLVLLDKAPADLKQLPSTAPRVAVPENISDFYLLIFHEPSDSKNPIKLRLIDAKQNASQKGQMMWFNFTKLQVQGLVGKTALSLKPGEKKNLPPPASSQDHFLVELGYRIPGNEFLYPICRNQWLYNHKGIAALVFIYPRSKQEEPVIQMFTDFRSE